MRRSRLPRNRTVHLIPRSRQQSALLVFFHPLQGLHEPIGMQAGVILNCYRAVASDFGVLSESTLEALPRDSPSIAESTCCALKDVAVAWLMPAAISVRLDRSIGQSASGM